MRRLLLFTIFFLVLIRPVNGEIITSINLYQDQIGVYDNTTLRINNEINLGENASLILRNTHLILETTSTFNITLNDNTHLTLINSTIECDKPLSIRLRNQATATIFNSSIYGATIQENETIYIHGFGLSENSKLIANQSKIGYVRQTGNASSYLTQCTIGDFGTKSMGILSDSGSTINRATFFLENCLCEINNTLHQKQLTYKTENLVTDGNSPPFKLENTFIINPPNIFAENCILFLKDTSLNDVYLTGDSGADIYNTKLNRLYLEKYEWITSTQSNLNEIICYNGDFNLEFNNTQLSSLITYMTIGLNLRMENSRINLVNLMYAHTSGPHNIEFINSIISKLYIKPGGPTLYQFENTTIADELILEPDLYNYTSPTFSGALNFGDNLTITYVPGEGKTTLSRIYLLRLMEGKKPLSNTQVTLSRKQTDDYTGTTDEEGYVVVKLSYTKELKILETAQPDGSYLINTNEFIEPVNITSNGYTTQIGVLTKAPLTIEILGNNKENVSDDSDNEKTSIPFQGVTIAIILYIIIAQKIKPTQKNILK